MQRLILEIGTGNDLYGGNYTKAACRAVQDAIHHSSLILFRSLDISHEKMQVNVTKEKTKSCFTRRGTRVW